MKHIYNLILYAVRIDQFYAYIIKSIPYIS